MYTFTSENPLFCTENVVFCSYLQNNKSVELSIVTHSLIHHFENVPSSKKLQTTTDMWLLKDF